MGYGTESSLFGIVAAVLGIVLILTVVLRMWKKVPQDKAGVVTGMKKRVITGGGGLVIPVFERIDYISLGNFPAAFTTLTYIQPEIWYANYSTLYMWCTAVYGPSTTSAGSVAVITNAKFSGLVEVMYTAIGRWK